MHDKTSVILLLHLLNTDSIEHHGRWIYNLLCNQCLLPLKNVSWNPVHDEVYSIQHYVIKFVSDLRQVGGFLRFPSSIKLTATI